MHELTHQAETQSASQEEHGAKARVVLSKLNESQNDACQSKALVADLISKLETAEALLGDTKVDMLSLSQDCGCLEKQVNDLNILLGDRDANVVLLESQIEECDGVIEAKTAKISNLREQLSTEEASSLEAK